MPHLQPRRLQQPRVLRHAWKVPMAVRQVATLACPPHFAWRLRCGCTLPRPPSSATKRPPTRKASRTHRIAASGGRTQCSTALEKTASNGSANAKSRRVALHEFDRRVGGASLRKHLGRVIQTHDRRPRLGDLRRQVAGAASQVEDAFTRFRVQQLHQRRPMLPDECVSVVVQIGVPALIRYSHAGLLWRVRSNGRGRGRRLLVGHGPSRCCILLVGGVTCWSPAPSSCRRRPGRLACRPRRRP